MIDISSISTDLVMLNTQTQKAKNVLQVQLGALEYAQTFGIDLEFFLDPDFQFQNESFKAYCVQRLSESFVNVNQVIEALETFSLDLTFSVGDSERASADGGLIR